MKYLPVILILLITTAAFSQNGKVGIGTSAPKARLHVADSSVVFTGAALFPTIGDPPVSGSGRRMMWYVDKAAFRAGAPYITEWDKDSIGEFSVAMGAQTMAKGQSSVALGQGTSALTAFAFASGLYCVAAGNGATAMGQYDTAAGINSTAMGFGCYAGGGHSIAMGRTCRANFESNIAIGYNCITSHFAATAIGLSAEASGRTSIAIGNEVKAPSLGEVVLGSYNALYTPVSDFYAAPTDRIFSIGNGSFETGRSNALTILKNGNVGIGTTVPGSKLTVVHNSSTASPTLVLQESETDYARLQYSNLASTRNWQTAAFSDVNNHANSKYNIFYFNGSTGTDILSISGNGNAVLTGTLTQLSDMRLKRNISPITTAMQQLQQIGGYHYYWKDAAKDQALQSGVLAQEIERVFPELVKTDDRGNLSVNYAGLVPYVIEAAKTHEQQIQLLLQENKILQQRLEKLERLMDQIK